MSLGYGIRIFVSFVLKNFEPIIREFSEVVRWPQDSNSSSRSVYVWPTWLSPTFFFIFSG